MAVTTRSNFGKLLALTFTFIIITITTYTWNNAKSRYQELTPADTSKNLKVIMMPDRMKGSYLDSYFKDCEFTQCKFIYSTQFDDAKWADVVVVEFNSAYLIRRISFAENIVRPDHPVIILSHESPGYCRWSSASNTFSGTTTYSLNSTIYYPFDSAIPIPDNERENKNSKVDYAKGKTKGAYVYVSNCYSSHYNRLEVMKQLSKYIDVDIYGKCTNNKPCPERVSIGCEAEAHSKYRFYLSFENSLCKDYITEKFWKILRSSAGFIPVAIGGKSIEDYYRVAPPDSFIHAYNFSSIEKLGNYLRYLMNNDAAFNRYHQWRQRYKIIDSRPKLACDLCKLAHNTSILPPPTNSLADDWNDSNHCAMLQMDDYKPNMGNHNFWRKIRLGFC